MLRFELVDNFSEKISKTNPVKFVKDGDTMIKGQWFIALSLIFVAQMPQKSEAFVPQGGVNIATQYKPVVGAPHPDFVLPSIDGDESISLSKYRGKKVLLLHFASW